MAIGDKYDGGIGQAVHLMQFYMSTLAGYAGMRWDSDNHAEVQSMVECIVNAAKLEAESAAPEALVIPDMTDMPDAVGYLEQIAALLIDSESLPTDESDVADAACIVQTVKNALDKLTAERDANIEHRRKIAVLEAQIIAVPVESISAIVNGLPVDNWNRKPLAAVKKWLAGGVA